MLLVNRAEVGSFDMEDGTKQGDPFSALAFVWSVDCFIRFKAQSLSIGYSLSVSLAGDMCDVVEDLLCQARRWSACFKLLAKATGLELGYEKCFVWIFDQSREEEAKAILRGRYGALGYNLVP